jgi:drug/metabolite transporter (DMT)-like permease
MLAVLGGLGAALAFATTTLCASRSTRMIGPFSVLAWTMLVGFCLVIPWAVLEGVPASLDGVSAGWLAAAGLGNAGGLLLTYSALRVGKVGIVAPIVSTEGAVAAAISILAGEQIAKGSGLMLAVIALGIVLAAAARAPNADTLRADSKFVPLYAVCAAFCFGVSIYATGRASDSLPVGWAIAPPRVAGVLFVAVPLLVSSRLRLTRSALPLVAVAGVAEVLGFASYALGSRHGIAVSAVLASQFAAIAAIAAYFLFHERLTRVQLAGVVLIVAGVAALILLQA